MADMVTVQELENAKIDARTIGESVNENKIVTPRYGAPFKSMPMIAEEMQSVIGTIIAGGVPASIVADQSGKSQQQVNDETITTSRYGSVGKAQNIPVSDWYTIGSTYYRGYADLAAVQVDYPHVTSATNTVDWAAAQKALNVADQGGAVKVIGCLFLQQGEKLLTKEAQRIYGGSPGYFINTNNGLNFTGALIGTLPKSGIYYDGTSGACINAGAGTVFSNLHIFGRGYIDTSGAVNILDPKGAKAHPTVGIEAKKFIITDNVALYYFGEAVNHIEGGGDYYSRYSLTEVTRCNSAFGYDETAYNQHFFGCTIRNIPTPFRFKAGTTCRTFNYFGGSVEGFRPVDGNTYAIGIPANCIMRFPGTYFENLDSDIVFDEVFGFTGGNSFLQLIGCTVYLNHFKNWVRQRAYSHVRVTTSGNEFYLSTSSRVKNPTMYELLTVKGASYLYADGTDKVNYATGYPNETTTGSAVLNSTTLNVANIGNITQGQRIRILGATNHMTVVTNVSGTTVTMQSPAPIAYTDAVVELYYTPNYVPVVSGLALLNNADLKFPSDYLPQFDDIEFKTTPGVVRSALSHAPYKPFNGGSSGSAIYIADGTNWNPSSRSDAALGAYPTVFRGGRWFSMLGSFTGSFTFPAGTEATVPNKNVGGTSKIIPIPTNAAAATLMKNGWYISAKNNATSFVMTTQTAALGTETFDYTITD